MLTLLYPNLIPIIQEMPAGILSINVEDKACPMFIVKAPKEYILAAKINAGFKIYLAPVQIDNQRTFGFVTAFFDDEDEPLVIRTPLFADDFARILLDSLRNGQINVHFFDELAREQLVYRAEVTIPDVTQKKINKLSLLKPSRPDARVIIDEMSEWFSLRTSCDDNEAINVFFSELTFGENLFIQDMRPERHAYHGSRGHSHTFLEREEAGRYQEEDVINCLLLIFEADKIYHSPKRVYDGEEICDILVVTDSKLLIIQTKDSPNTERISRQSLSRKRSNVLRALKKAINQVKGAVGYCQRIKDKLEFVINGNQYSIDISGLEVMALVVVKELFNNQYIEYSELLLDLFEDKAVPCIALDYPELYLFCVHLRNEDSFFAAFNTLLAHAVTHGSYPRLRFGLGEKIL